MNPRHFTGEVDSGDAATWYDQGRIHQASQAQRYRDSPSREVMSPPPGYMSPDPPDSPTQSSPSQAFLDHPSHKCSRPQETVQEYRYLGDTPPQPPPHGIRSANPNRSSVARRPIGAPMPMSDEHHEHDGSSHSERGREDTYPIDDISNAYMPTQPPFVTQDQSRNSSPQRQPQRSISQFHDRGSYSSSMPIVAGAMTPGSSTPARTPDNRSSRMSERSIPLTEYSSRSYRPVPTQYNNMPYYNSSHDFDPAISNASINPHDIVDDGDDGFIPDPQRRSFMALGKPRSTSGNAARTSALGASGAAGMSMIDNSQHAGTKSMNASSNPLVPGNDNEKSAWLSKTTGSNRRFRLWAGVGIGIFIILAIVGAIVGAVLGTKSSQGGGGKVDNGNINNANDDLSHNGDLDINSQEIKALMNNKNLHKVFPGMDYTSWGVQYPTCLTYPPSQNNVTRDIAILSQLTNTVRLYGNDCNQTEMVIHAMNRLKLKDMKLWLGVWIDQNQTTTNRQIHHMYEILEEIKDHSVLKGVIIGNEALFRAGETKAEAQQELITLMSNTRQNFTSLGYKLPVGTSDLGDNWDATITQASDFVMSNIHPFFAGVSAESAAAWTWNFWQQHNVLLSAGTNKPQIISETGWPSAGGTDCGGADGSCAQGQPGAVASVDNMNTFMNSWVCQALANGTDYFWFEAFDEPWKVQYNTPGKAWEDKWGLMDSGRNLKPGIKIPNCGGQTVS